MKYPIIPGRLRDWRTVGAALAAAAGIALVTTIAHPTGSTAGAIADSVGSSTTIGRDDYPGYQYGGFDTVDPITDFYIGNCTDFVAWRLRNEHLSFSNSYGGVHWGNAWEWKAAAQAAHITFDSRPLPGDVAVFPAWWPTGVVGDQIHNLTYAAGHVAIVDSVNADGSIYVEDYNWRYVNGQWVAAGQYHQHTLPSGGVSFLNFFPQTSFRNVVPDTGSGGGSGSASPSTKNLTLRVADGPLAGHYASARGDAGDVVAAGATSPQAQEQFTLIPVSGDSGAYYIRSQATGKYVSARFDLSGDQRGTLYANVSTPGPWETFHEQQVGSNQAFYVYDGNGAKWYVATEMNQGGVLRARTAPSGFDQNVDSGSWELFSVGS